MLKIKSFKIRKGNWINLKLKISVHFRNRENGVMFIECASKIVVKVLQHRVNA